MKKYNIEKTEAEWLEQLSPEAYRVLRQKGTERPFTGEYDHFFEDGKYTCRACGYELFTSESKYNSGCGWPAFYAESEAANIEKKTDYSHGMVRTEVLCPNCGGHLGHLFPDGPRDKTGMRYCINSISIQFEPKKED